MNLENYFNTLLQELNTQLQEAYEQLECHLDKYKQCKHKVALIEYEIENLERRMKEKNIPVSSSSESCPITKVKTAQGESK